MTATLDACAVLEAVAHGVVVLDMRLAGGAVAYANRAFTRMTGYEAAELLQRNVTWLSAPAADRDALTRFGAALAERQSAAFELMICCKDGNAFWSRVQVAPLHASVEADYIVVTCEDISAHKRARASLRTSEARLEVAMEAGELSMWDWNLETDEISYNEQWRISLGVDPRRLVERQDVAQRLMLPDAAEILEQFERHYRGDAPHFAAEYPLPTATGESKWFAAHAKVVRRDAAGKPLRIIGVLRDIAQQKQQMQEAKAVQQQWERAVRGASDGLYDWDLLTGRVWYAERFRELIGYDEHDFRGTFQAFQRVLHAEDRPLVLAGIRAHLESGEALDVRCRVATAGGASIWCRLRGRAERDAAGRPVRLSGSISDITLQVETEAALRDARRGREVLHPHDGTGILDHHAGGRMG